MSTIVLRATKGSPLTNTEVDSNFSNLNTDKLEATWTGNTTLVTLGTVTTGTWSATTIAATKGGTGQSAYTIGDLLYASSTSALSKLSLGTTGQVLTAGASGPSYVNQSTLSVGSATNISGGGAGQLAYNTASGTTSFLSLGTSGYVLTAGASAPTYVAQSSLSVGSATTAGTATNVAGGTAGAVHYQTGAGATSFLSIGSTNYIMTSSGTAPRWSQYIGIGQGGTGATTVADAQTNLQVDPAGTAVALSIALG